MSSPCPPDPHHSRIDAQLTQGQAGWTEGSWYSSSQTCLMSHAKLKCLLWSEAWLLQETLMWGSCDSSPALSTGLGLFWSPNLTMEGYGERMKGREACREETSSMTEGQMLSVSQPVCCLFGFCLEIAMVIEMLSVPFPVSSLQCLALPSVRNPRLAMLYWDGLTSPLSCLAFCSAGDQTQGLVHTRQALYQVLRGLRQC